MTLVQKGEEGGRKKEVATPPALAKLYLGARTAAGTAAHGLAPYLYL